MKTETLILNAKRLISKAQIQKSFDLLLENISDKELFKDDIISLKNRYSTLIEENNKDRISSESFQVETNKILNTYLELLGEIEYQEEKKADISTEILSGFDSYNIKSKLIEYIQSAEYRKAFATLRKWINTNDIENVEYNRELEILSSQFNQVKNNRRKGIIEIKEYNISLNKIVERLISLIDNITQAPLKAEKYKEKQAQIKTSAASYVQESISELSKREQRLKFQAFIWYIIGFLALISGIIIAVVMVNTNLVDLKTTIGIIYIVLKNLFIIGLLVAASRYAFNLGKTYMNESLKNADRIHAISFGKFYLQVFSEDLKSEDLKDVFKEWNTYQETPFVKLDSNEFDPKLLQAFLQFADLIKNNKK